MTCSIEGCDRRVQARGWCHKHYMHWFTYGDPLPRPKPTIEERLRARLMHSDQLFEGTPCWEWQGQRLPAGYGVISIKNRHHYTHRIAWELFRGPIPDGFQIDHRCENKSCCNPDHLEPVLPVVNTRRWSRSITHCPAGHEYDERNTRVNAQGGRHCRACGRERARKKAVAS